MGTDIVGKYSDLITLIEEKDFHTEIHLNEIYLVHRTV
jgi:hypothetical protein